MQVSRGTTLTAPSPSTHTRRAECLCFCAVVSEELQPSRLLEHLHTSIALNGLKDVCEVVRIDWHHREEAVEKFPIVIGSDVIYYERDAKALAQTVIERTEPGGAFVSAFL